MKRTTKMAEGGSVVEGLLPETCIDGVSLSDKNGASNEDEDMEEV